MQDQEKTTTFPHLIILPYIEKEEISILLHMDIMFKIAHSLRLHSSFKFISRIKKDRRRFIGINVMDAREIKG